MPTRPPAESLRALNGIVLTYGQYQMHMDEIELYDPFARIIVRIMHMGQDVTPEGVNPVLIANAPRLVPDPAGPITRENDPGQRYRYDPDDAMISILNDLLVQIVGTIS